MKKEMYEEWRGEDRYIVKLGISSNMNTRTIISSCNVTFHLNQNIVARRLLSYSFTQCCSYGGFHLK